jgi:hypothetical protein
MGQSLSGSIGNPLLGPDNIAVGALVKFKYRDINLGLVMQQIDSGSHLNSRFWVYHRNLGKPVFFGTYLECLELIQINTGSCKV